MRFSWYTATRPPLYKQLDSMDCAPACLQMICAHYGKKPALQDLRDLTGISRNGVSLYNLKKAAESLGFATMSIKTNQDKIVADTILPCILHWDRNHYVILYKIKKGIYYIVDPAVGYVTYPQEEFLKLWQTQGSEGVLLLLQPTPAFSYDKSHPGTSGKQSFKTVYEYLKRHRSFFLQLIIGLIASSAIQLSFPFLTKNIVDKGITNKNINFIVLIAVGQTVLVASRMIMDFLRSWILLHISLRVNLSLISAFLIKLMKLPLSFFDTKNVGDIFQRINDHKRIEQFLTVSTLSTLFSFFTFIIFSVVLFSYSPKIFLIFIAASTLYFVWSVLFLKRRKELDYKRFNISAKNQNVLLQLIEGMSDIKLNNAELKKRGDWENIQADMYQLNAQSLLLGQAQQSGAFLINEVKNIIIVCLSAYSVIKGEVTLGTMMAIQYIIGQLNTPINQFISIIQIIQDAKISMDRINEIHTFKDEFVEGRDYIEQFPSDDLQLSAVSFTYPGQHLPVLKNINLTIPQGKTTAIVGTSGSGKTTLLKILLKFYTPQQGKISLGDTCFSDIDIAGWRKRCGAVLQDGYIFSDSIARNIAPEAQDLNYEKINHSVHIANLDKFVTDLAAGLETNIGAEGNGISQGQKQRILIARSVYKDPEYLFFDEATNALDANNEKIILKRLQSFFENRTVVVVAHRLSTVKNADKIVVLEEGEIVEEGTHFELTELRGKYYELVKNQLELAEN